MQDMQEHFDRLGLAVGATPAEIKAAYHAQLKAFPAHQYPQEFKAIRAAYEALKNAPTETDFFELKPIEVELDLRRLEALRSQATDEVEVSLKDLIYLTF